LVEFHARNESYPGLAEVVERTLEVTWYAPRESTAYRQEIRNAVDRVVLDLLLREAGSEANTAQVRAILAAEAADLAIWLEALEVRTPHQQLALDDIRRWQQRPEGAAPASPPLDLPPGSPIGTVP